MKESITLSTGRVVVYTEMTNGAHESSMQDGAPMTETEWQELCEANIAANREMVAKIEKLRKNGNANWRANRPASWVQA